MEEQKRTKNKPYTSERQPQKTKKKQVKASNPSQTSPKKPKKDKQNQQPPSKNYPRLQRRTKKKQPKKERQKNDHRHKQEQTTHTHKKDLIGPNLSFPTKSLPNLESGTEFIFIHILVVLESLTNAAKHQNLVYCKNNFIGNIKIS